MDAFSTGDLNFILLIIPGFIIVWTFRHFSKAKKIGDFEYLGLSFVWGLISLLIFESLVYLDCWLGVACHSGNPETEISSLLNNPYSAALAFMLIGSILGCGGSWIVSSKFFKKAVQFITPKKLDKRN